MSNGTLLGAFTTGVALINGVEEFVNGVLPVIVEEVTPARAGCAITPDLVVAAATLGRVVGIDDNTRSAGGSGGTDWPGVTKAGKV